MLETSCDKNRLETNCDKNRLETKYQGKLSLNFNNILKQAGVELCQAQTQICMPAEVEFQTSA